jgi:hypothetical protein
MAGLIVTVVALFALIPAAFAQGPLDGYGQGRYNQGAFGRDAGMVGQNQGADYGLGGPEQSLVAVAAEQLGLSQADLVAELQAGQTLAKVITAHGGSPEQIVENFLVARSEQLAGLVAAGQITQEQADSWLVTMEENATSRLDQAGSPQGNNAGFTDEDGDGACDYVGSGPRDGHMSQRWQ